ncbi:MAG: hypothetical protein ACK4RN_08980 [Pseudorhodobacter sp.]
MQAVQTLTDDVDAVQQVKDTASPDLTMIVDPVTLWPKPEDCPVGLFDLDLPQPQAEAMLASLVHRCNGGKATRKPTPAECASALAAHFSERNRAISGMWERQWDAMGGPFPGLAPNNHSGLSHDIVRALYLRGHVRRLQHVADQSAKRRVADAQRAQAGKVAAFPDHLQNAEAEIAACTEAAARHAQRMKDERMARGLPHLRFSLEAVWRDACNAAKTIGEPAPPRPTILDE